MDNNVLRKNRRPNKQPIALWMDEEHKAKYDKLSAHGVRAAEHMRMVVYPELDRLYELEFGSDQADAG